MNENWTWVMVEVLREELAFLGSASLVLSLLTMSPAWALDVVLEDWGRARKNASVTSSIEASPWTNLSMVELLLIMAYFAVSNGLMSALRHSAAFNMMLFVGVNLLGLTLWCRSQQFVRANQITTWKAKLAVHSFFQPAALAIVGCFFGSAFFVILSLITSLFGERGVRWLSLAISVLTFGLACGAWASVHRLYYGCVKQPPRGHEGSQEK